jgi:hypothetical protein
MSSLPGRTAATSISGVDARLAGYLAAAGALGATLADSSEAAIVASTLEMPFGVNGEVNIDFNGDGQTDFQVDHDRVELAGGPTLDYLQIDKNDANGADNPLPFNNTATFPPGASTPNDATQAAYVVPVGQGDYPAALSAGTLIGPGSTWDYQEGDNFLGSGKWIRANRMLDEDATQIDQILGGRTAAQVQAPTNGPSFAGLAGDVRYLGVRADLNGTGQMSYGWIGLRIDNEADATGAVVGYGYQSVPGAPIPAGAVPEPGAGLLTAVGLAAACLWRKRGRRR